jgi:hypothetical protein
MATAFGFDIGTAAQGAVFALTAAVKNDRTHAFPTWEAELRRGLSHLCLRGGTPEDKPLETIVAAAHPFAEDVLDIVSVEERLALLVSEPHDCLVWRRGAHGLKAQLTTSITFAAEPLAVRAVVEDAQGNIVPDPPYVPPQHHAAYRYFRYLAARRYRRALHEAKRSVTFEPYSPLAHWTLGRAYLFFGRHRAAIATLQRGSELARNSAMWVAELCYARGAAGDRTGADRLVRSLFERSRHEYISPFDLATACLGVGDRSGASDQLEKAFTYRVMRLTGLGDPEFDCLGTKRRSLLRRLGLPGA